MNNLWCSLIHIIICQTQSYLATYSKNSILFHITIYTSYVMTYTVADQQHYLEPKYFLKTYRCNWLWWVTINVYFRFPQNVATFPYLSLLSMHWQAITQGTLLWTQCVSQNIMMACIDSDLIFLQSLALVSLLIQPAQVSQWLKPDKELIYCP